MAEPFDVEAAREFTDACRAHEGTLRRSSDPAYADLLRALESLSGALGEIERLRIAQSRATALLEVEKLRTERLGREVKAAERERDAANKMADEYERAMHKAADKRDELRAEVERLYEQIGKLKERLKRREPQPETATMSWPKP